ncbi:MAG: DUF1847 domain-containing protein [Synergistaceae bacterium]|jgi:uncharacterized metal-binding protein|nr:DUF1847 domain-containing protein [Synergistaceae bacterium]
MSDPRPLKNLDKLGNLSCANCTVGNCSKLTKSFPDFCLTTNAREGIVEDVTKRYVKSPKDRKIALAAAEIESAYYGRATRVEEILIFIEKMGYKKVGAATCAGLLNECSTFARIARAKGIEIYGVACKVGAVDKTVIGLTEEQKISPGSHESMCNPILQAELLNEEKTDFNVIIGLCAGHDTLFIKHSKAPVTYLVVKDRVLCHNPAAALYGANTYYRRLLGPELPK